jgi:hypothetical protein
MTQTAVEAGVPPGLFYFSASDFRRRMISARLRSELFTASAFGKTSLRPFQHNDITSPRIELRVFSADTF